MAPKLKLSQISANLLARAVKRKGAYVAKNRTQGRVRFAILIKTKNCYLQYTMAF